MNKNTTEIVRCKMCNTPLEEVPTNLKMMLATYPDTLHSDGLHPSELDEPLYFQCQTCKTKNGDPS